VKLGITLVAALKRSHPKEMELRSRRFDILTGSQDIRHLLDDFARPETIWEGWKSGLEEFGSLREKYLMYGGEPSESATEFKDAVRRA
jgi:uncharacterized protein YbbC (DUF1343 family)